MQNTLRALCCAVVSMFSQPVTLLACTTLMGLKLGTMVQWIPRPFPWGTAAGHRPPPLPSSAEVKESVELFLYSVSGPPWPVRG